MKALLKNLGFHMASYSSHQHGSHLNEDVSSFQDQCFDIMVENLDASQLEEIASPPSHLRELLASLHKHLLAYCYTNANDDTRVSRPFLLFAQPCFHFVGGISFTAPTWSLLAAAPSFHDAAAVQ